MKIECYKILASGSYKRFAWFRTADGFEFCLRVNDDVYYKLKDFGVPTSQSLRGKKK